MSVLFFMASQAILLFHFIHAKAIVFAINKMDTVPESDQQVGVVDVWSLLTEGSV